MRIFLGIDALIIAIYSVQTFDTHRDWLGIGIGVILMFVALVSVFTATDIATPKKPTADPKVEAYRRSLAERAERAN